MRSPHISIASVLLAGWLGAAVAQPVASAQVVVSEPRAYGHQVGDVVARDITLALPVGSALDESSLPVPGRVSHALELRSLVRSSTADGRLALRLEYQWFAAPPLARVYELPPLVLRVVGTQPGAASEELRVDAWPVALAPLVPENGLARRGLGDLRPDASAPLHDTRLERLAIAWSAAVAVLALLWLAAVYLGLPWWGRRARPFQRAYRGLRAGAGATAAWRSLHAAFDRTAGRTLFADGVDDFLRAMPRFAPLREEILSFYTRSQRGFFAASKDDAAARADAAWLLGFARACRDAERGLAG